ncbi:MAG: FAD-binding protein, partial [Alphaproteobacteria bacterium]
MYASENYFPRNEEELCGLVAQASSEGLPLEVCGNRTKRNIGRPLEIGVKEGARLSTRQITGVTLYEPQELVLSAHAGTPLSQIETLLDEHNQELAFEPSRLENLFEQGEDAEATLGGVIAANASGPRRILRGAARDYVLGARAVNGKGEVIKSGGRVMKNVTGYDIARALAGSWGTLAVMSEITLKVLPKAEEMRTLVFLGLPREAAISAMCTAMGTPYEVSATVHLSPEFVARHSDPDIAGLEQAVTALRLESFSASLEYRAGRLHHQLKPFGAIYELDDVRSRAFWDDIRSLSFVAKPTSEDAYLAASVWPL